MYNIMKWYPWLNIPYRDILFNYQEKQHHAFLLESQPGNGEISLCYAISRWLMCQNRKGKKSCGICQSCHLMIVENHPDFYILKLDKNNQYIGIDSIRNIIYHIHHYSHWGGMKVIWIPNVEKLTEQAINALLKILEEPPINTYFLLICSTRLRLLPTLKSRCFCWSLPTLHESISLYWLKKEIHINKISAQTALRLCYGSPLLAKDLLISSHWKKRMELCDSVYNTLICKNFMLLLSILNQYQDNEILYWFLSLLLDTLKWKNNLYKFITNCDQIVLIKLFSSSYSSNILYIQIQKWMNFLYQLYQINGINRELLLMSYLYDWDYDINNN